MASKEDLEVLVAELQRKLEEAETKISESEEGAKDEGVVPAWLSVLLDQQQRAQKEMIKEIISSMADCHEPTDQSQNPSRPTPALRSVNSGARPVPPPRLDVKLPDTIGKDVNYKEFVQWRRTWDNYATMSKVKERTREEQIALFRQCCSPPLREKMIHSMEIPDDTELTLPEIFNSIQNFLDGRRNLALERRNLLNRKQGETEDFEDFYTSLCTLAEDAELRQMTYDEWLSNLIFVGWFLGSPQYPIFVVIGMRGGSWDEILSTLFPNGDTTTCTW